MPDPFERANYFKTDPVQQDGCADRRPARKENAPGLVSNYNHRAFLDHVKIIQPAALGDRQITNLIEICRNSQQFSTALEIVADGANIVTLNYRGRQLYVRAIVFNVLKVAVSKKIPSQACEAAVHCRGTAAPYEHDILANLVKLLAVAGTKAFP